MIIIIRSKHLLERCLCRSGVDLTLGALRGLQLRGAVVGDAAPSQQWRRGADRDDGLFAAERRSHLLARPATEHVWPRTRLPLGGAAGRLRRLQVRTAHGHARRTEDRGVGGRR